MRYVVTGAAGFIGSHLLRTLLERGHEAVGWDAFTDYYDPALKEENAEGLPVERVDLAADAIVSTASTVSSTWRAAGRASFGDVFPVYVRQNVLASQRAVRGRRRGRSAHRARVVLLDLRRRSCISDARGHAAPLSPYGITKLACEHLASAYGQEFGLDAVALRYFTIFGPRQRPDMALAKMIACLVEGRTFELHGDGSQSRSVTYVEDAVEATILAMERGPAAPSSTSAAARSCRSRVRSDPCRGLRAATRARRRCSA